MPRRDGTGPNSAGPMTGRGAGNCSGGSNPGVFNGTPNSPIPRSKGMNPGADSGAVQSRGRGRPGRSGQKEGRARGSGRGR